MNLAHEDLGYAADCVMALVGEGGSQDDAYIGALLVAEMMHVITSFLGAKP